MTHRSGFPRLATDGPDANAALPKMPPFDYAPPLYEGPTAADILKKRAEFLSPSMFYFYRKPVGSHLSLSHYSSPFPCSVFFFYENLLPNFKSRLYEFPPLLPPFLFFFPFFFF